MRVFLVVMALFLGFAADAQQYQGTTAAVRFEIKNAGLTVDGKFEGFKGKIFFNPTDLSTAVLQGSIETKTINTNITARDRHLRKADYFDVERYATIILHITSISKKGAAYLAKCQLTIKGTMREIDIPVVLSTKDGAPLLTSEFSLNRLDYKVGSSNLFLSDKVKIFITAPLTQLP